MNNNYSSKRIKQISYDLGSSVSNPVAESSQLTLLRKKLWNCEADHSKKEATKISYITTKLNKIQAK